MSVTTFLSAFFLTASSALLLAGPGTSNPYGGKRVLVIGIDGCRPDALKQQVDSNNAPNIKALVNNGTVTWNAYAGGDLGTATQQVTMSGPGWTSILTGTWIDRHNVSGNSSPAYDQPAVSSSYLVSQAPHFARLLKESAPGTYCSSIVSWNWIEDYIVAAQPSWLDHHAKGTGSTYPLRDADVAAQAVAHLGSADPDVLFLHFDQVDGAGHANGFSPSQPAYMAAISNVDALIGNIISAINARPQITSEQWLTIIVADHGGNSSHGGQSTEERTIPFIVSGGGMPVAVSGASPGHVAVAPTVMRYLGIGIPASWQFAQNAFVTGPTFAATGSSGAVQLDWSLPAAGIPGATGFEIFRNGSSIGTFPLTQTSLTDPFSGSGVVNYQLSFVGTTEAKLNASIYFAAPGQIAWDDTNSNNTWNTSDANWSGGSVFANGLQALFPSTGETITVSAGGVSPSDTSIIGNGAYTFTGGPISGTLTKGGSGVLALNASNNFTAAALNGGSLGLGNAGALGSGALTVATGASTDTTGGAILSTTAITSNAVIPNAITLPSDTSAANRALYMYGTGNTTNTVEFSGKLSGGTSFTKLYLNNNQSGAYNPQFILTNSTNDFRANVWINRGGLQISSNEALGNPSNTVTFDSNNGADLTFNNSMTYTRATALSTGTDFDTKTNTVTASGVISGSGAFTKLGSGTLSLTAANTFTGATTISAGTLRITSSGTSAITANSGATLNGSATGSTNKLLTLNAGAFLAADTTGAFTSNGVNLAGTTSLVFTSTPVSGTTYDVLKYGATGATNPTNLTAATRGTVTQDTVNNKFTFTAGAAATRTWNVASGTWDNMTTPNFAEGDLKFSTGDTVIFNNPSAAATVTLSGQLFPASVSVTNTNAYTFSGTGGIGGTGSLSKSGTGTLTLSSANSYSGGTTVSGGPDSASTGSIAVGNSSALGTGGVTLNNTGTMTALFFPSGFASNSLANNITFANAAITTKLLTTAGINQTVTLSGILSGGNAGATIYLNNTASAGVSKLRLSNSSNSILGKWQLNRGALEFTSDAALGNPANDIVLDVTSTNAGTGLTFGANNITLNTNRSITISSTTIIDTGAFTGSRIDGAVAINGQLIKRGAGDLTLSAANTGSSAVLVNAGTLLVNGSMTTSANAVTVSAGATLGGSGTINRPVIITGTIAPGAGIGTLTTGATTIDSTYACEVSGSTSDQIAATDLTFGASSVLAVTDSSGVFPRIIATYSGTLTGTFSTVSAGFVVDYSTPHQIILKPAGTAFSNWADSKGLAGLNAAFNVDPDGDGIANGMEFVLGGEPNPANPGSNSTSLLPNCSLVGNNLVFTYHRADAAAGYPVTVEFTNNPSTPWTTAVDPANSTITAQDGSPLDTITVAIPKGAATKLFARLKVVAPD